jgi:integrase
MTAATTLRKPDATFRTALKEYEHWRLHRANFSLKTWAGEKPGLLKFVDLMIARGRTYVGSLTEEDVNTWWDLSTSSLAPSTQKTRLAQLRSFLRFCIARGWLESNPTVLLRAKVPAKGARDRLTADELLALVDLAENPRDRVLLALATNLGVRGGEIARLRLRDLNLRAETIRVHVDKTNEVDDMPLSAELTLELHRWLEAYRGTPYSPASFLVPSIYFDNYNQRWLYRHDKAFTEPYRVVQAALTKMGWDTHGEGVHTVRRSVATLFFDMIEADESFDSALVATMALLHHARPEQTLEYVGRKRATMARDRVLKGHSFLTRLAAPSAIRLVK